MQANLGNSKVPAYKVPAFRGRLTVCDRCTGGHGDRGYISQRSGTVDFLLIRLVTKPHFSLGFLTGQILLGFENTRNMRAIEYSNSSHTFKVLISSLYRNSSFILQ